MIPLHYLNNTLLHRTQLYPNDTILLCTLAIQKIYLTRLHLTYTLHNFTKLHTSLSVRHFAIPHFTFTLPILYATRHNFTLIYSYFTLLYFTSLYLIQYTIAALSFYDYLPSTDIKLIIPITPYNFYLS